ncbi:hypothetical protein TSAR_013973 [Trichomalopsis sarcophagae]|uniref:Uncharacterized protein n=1 Tax=Trichomalopsis sarcophagae TaxID=543379 RepID=A0A232FDW3_9HYME|nr:hypothetical protein TSAR_013973 [Trichomalopsis sarcophagae]
MGRHPTPPHNTKRAEEQAARETAVQLALNKWEERMHKSNSRSTTWSGSVIASSAVQGINAKSAPKYAGPFRITTRLGQDVYRLENSAGEVLEKIHVVDLKRYLDGEESPTDEDLQEEATSENAQSNDRVINVDAPHKRDEVGRILILGFSPGFPQLGFDKDAESTTSSRNAVAAQLSRLPPLITFGPRREPLPTVDTPEPGATQVPDAPQEDVAPPAKEMTASQANTTEEEWASVGVHLEKVRVLKREYFKAEDEAFGDLDRFLETYGNPRQRVPTPGRTHHLRTQISDYTL